MKSPYGGGFFKIDLGFKAWIYYSKITPTEWLFSAFRSVSCKIDCYRVFEIGESESMLKTLSSIGVSTLISNNMYYDRSGGAKYDRTIYIKI